MDITVCVGSTCYLKGSYNVINGLKKLVEENKLEDRVVIKGACCLENCCKPVSIKVDDGPVLSVDESSLEVFFQENIISKLQK
ncbi:(2Fe-2S) ferredoxin domain-containing protein [Clostridium sp. ZS2-4]|uniref:(2Fe-2S) ferredoxin domain-containing protein n=1 Tax=Clostridium sp. ZS2-4 TaxID=2987703 RepID=UPI00227A652B|nr:(2Fe-2S) ferredoxin domain-containing protein [Clostridium sp. ZS2-4]MCY6353747.1 (2Fe-2S) ferredoxin domain-containing protein [Clostridium sp. ZS2-4]